MGPLKSKFFKSEKNTKSALKKSAYSDHFKSFPQKLGFWLTNFHLFLGHPVGNKIVSSLQKIIEIGSTVWKNSTSKAKNNENFARFVKNVIYH